MPPAQRGGQPPGGVRNAHNVSYDIRQEVFQKTVNLSGAQFDSFGLPSLISRLTSDSYNVQSAVQQLHTLCVRAPMLLAGGVAVTLVTDASLALVLAAMLPVLLLVVLAVSAKGLPMYRQVQQKLDGVVRVMRENITGIRVVKALSKTEYEKRRFARANDAMADSDIAAGTVMAIPSPFMQLCLNGGLTLVVFIGAGRVDGGTLEPGVILAFLTYFNMIAMGVMGLSRIFMTMSRAMASADRIDQVLQTRPGQQVLPPGQASRSSPPARPEPPPGRAFSASNTWASATARGTAPPPALPGRSGKRPFAASASPWSGGEPGHHRPHRLWQVHHRVPAHAVLRPGRRIHLCGRHRKPGLRHGFPAPGLRHGPPGHLGVPGHHL